MGIIRKQSTHTTILLYIGIVVGFIGSALVRPKILSEGEIGLLQIILNTTALVSGIFTLGANLTTIKMFPKFQTEDKSNRGLLSFILLVGLVGALLSIPFILSTSFFFFENSKGERFEGFSFNQGFYIGLILVIIARLFQNVLDAYLRSYHNSVVGVFSESIILKLFPVLGLLMYYLKWIDFQQLVYFNMVVFSIPVLLTLFFLKRIKVFLLVKPGPFSREEKKEMKEIAVVGLFEIISAGIMFHLSIR
jgi:O-antigen/teichoic acid export membrane protein